jgi:hypothetical protein
VLAVVLGTATNHCADAISITHPHGGTQEILYRSILEKACVDPLDIDYVEMHGTGTQAGDGTEMRSVTNVFAPADRKRSSEKPLYLGAINANVGHGRAASSLPFHCRNLTAHCSLGEAASGVTALIKSLMMLQKNAIPLHVGIKNTINKGFPKDLADRNIYIAFYKTLFLKKSGMPHRIFVNNFSAAGGNTGLLLEDRPAQKPAAIDPRSTHVKSTSGLTCLSILIKEILWKEEPFDKFIFTAAMLIHTLVRRPFSFSHIFLSQFQQLWNGLFGICILTTVSEIQET